MARPSQDPCFPTVFPAGCVRAESDCEPDTLLFAMDECDTVIGGLFVRDEEPNPLDDAWGFFQTGEVRLGDAEAVTTHPTRIDNTRDETVGNPELCKYGSGWMAIDDDGDMVAVWGNKSDSAHHRTIVGQAVIMTAAAMEGLERVSVEDGYLYWAGARKTAPKVESHGNSTAIFCPFPET